MNLTPEYLEKINKKLLKNPSDFNTKIEKAYFLLNVNEFESALIIFHEMSTLYPLNIEYTGAIGKIYYNLGDFHKAFPYLEKYYLRKNFSKDFIVEYALTIIKLGKFDKIKSVLNKMKKIKIEEKIINNIENNLESLGIKF